MRWITRHAVLALCFSLGTSAWYILAQKATTPAPTVQAAEEKTAVQANALSSFEQPEDARGEDVPGQSIKFGPIPPLTGYVNAQTLLLRDRAEPDAPVVTTLTVDDYATVEILGASGDFLHVRLKANEGANPREHEYEGWAKWGSVVPDVSAIVIDAETGAVVSRIPLGESVSSVTFSPDGSRAIFSSRSDEIRKVAYEVQTSDYTLTRSLISTGEEYFGKLFYGPADGALYTTVHVSSGPYPNKWQVSLIRVSEGEAANVASGLNINEAGFAISPDGLTGFFPHSEGGNSHGLTVDVIDLATQNLRNTFTITGTNLPSHFGNFVLSRDGSELYEKLSETTGAISVIDTRTGQIVRELQGSSTQGWSPFSQNDLVGDSLLLRVWEGEEEHARQRTFWVSNSGSVEAAAEIAYAVEAGGRRYAVNEKGTRLFKLDDDNSIRQKLTIARPERRKEATMGNGLVVFSLSASPDGKHLIMILGFEHGC
jgi:WD40 repeat protein